APQGRVSAATSFGWVFPPSLFDPALADNLEPVPLEPHVHRRRRIGQQHHLADAEIKKDLGTNTDLDEAALLSLALAAPLTARQAVDPVGDGPRPQVANEDEHPAALRLYGFHRLGDQRARSRFGPDAQDVGWKVKRMHPDERGAGL